MSGVVFVAEKTTWIAVVGDVATGFHLVGPFESHEAAYKRFESNTLSGIGASCASNYWTLLPLVSPADYKD